MSRSYRTRLRGEWGESVGDGVTDLPLMANEVNVGNSWRKSNIDSSSNSSEVKK